MSIVENIAKSRLPVQTREKRCVRENRRVRRNRK